MVDSTFFVEQKRCTKCHQKVSQTSFEIQYDGRNNPTVGSQAQATQAVMPGSPPSACT